MKDTDHQSAAKAESRKRTQTLNNVGKTLILLAFIVAAILLILGVKQLVDATKYSTDEGRAELGQQIEEEAQKLRNKQAELRNAGVLVSVDPGDGDGYKLNLINKALDPSSNYCGSYSFMNDATVGRYCTLSNNYKISGHSPSDAYAAAIPYFIGAGVSFVVLGAVGVGLTVTKKRKK